MYLYYNDLCSGDEKACQGQESSSTINNDDFLAASLRLPRVPSKKETPTELALSLILVFDVHPYT